MAAIHVEAAFGVAALCIALLFQRLPYFVRRRYELGVQAPKALGSAVALHVIVACFALLYTIAIRSGMHVVYAVARARIGGRL